MPVKEVKRPGTISLFVAISLLLHGTGLLIALFFTRPEVGSSPPPPPVTFYLAEADNSGEIEGGEETVNLASGGKGKYSDYLAHVKRRIEKHWLAHNPRLSNSGECTAVVRFTIDASGRLSSNRIVSSSGKAFIDEASLRIIRQAAPFAPIPPHYHLSRLHVIAHFHYPSTP